MAVTRYVPPKNSIVIHTMGSSCSQSFMSFFPRRCFSARLRQPLVSKLDAVSRFVTDRACQMLPRQTSGRAPPRAFASSHAQAVLPTECSPTAQSCRKHRRAEASPTPVDRGKECRDQRARLALTRRWETVPPARGVSQIDPLRTLDDTRPPLNYRGTILWHAAGF